MTSEGDGNTSGGAGSAPRGRDKVTIKIPRVLFNRLERVIAGTGFGSVTEFVVYVLRDLAASPRLADPRPLPPVPQAAQAPYASGEAKEELTPREVELIRERLRSLGYIE